MHACAQLFCSKTSKEPPNHLRNYPRQYTRGSAAFKSFASHFFLSQACNFVALMSLRTYVRRAATPLSWHSRMTSAIMPLKAKISHPTLAGSQRYSTSTESLLKEQPGDDPDDVLFNSIYGVRSIELNRPKKLNSLNGSMARKIIPRLQVHQALQNR